MCLLSTAWAPGQLLQPSFASALQACRPNMDSTFARACLTWFLAQGYQFVYEHSHVPTFLELNPGSDDLCGVTHASCARWWMARCLHHCCAQKPVRNCVEYTVSITFAVWPLHGATLCTIHRPMGPTMVVTRCVAGSMVEQPQSPPGAQQLPNPHPEVESQPLLPGVTAILADSVINTT